MILLNYSERASNYIDAADSLGNIRNNKGMLNYVRLCDDAVKNAGITTGAVYLFAGDETGDLSHSHKFNFLDSRDSDDAFRLTFHEGVSFTNNGLKGDGNTGYARTYYVPSERDENNSLVVYGVSTQNTTAQGSDLGAIEAIGNTVSASKHFSSRRNSTGTFFGQNNLLSNAVNVPNQSGIGVYACFNTGLINNAYKNANLLGIGSTASAISKPSYNICLLSRARNGNIPGGETQYSNATLSVVILSPNVIETSKIMKLSNDMVVLQRSIGRGI